MFWLEMVKSRTRAKVFKYLNDIFDDLEGKKASQLLDKIWKFRP